MAAALDVLIERRYSGFAIEAVAERARTSKAAIRRRWPTRQRLVIDALATLTAIPPVPDSGCTRCDLADSVELLFVALHDNLPSGVLPGLLSDCAEEPRLHRQLVEALVEPAYASVTAAITNAVQRGDLRADIEVELLVEQLTSVVYQRALLGAPTLRQRRAVELVDQLLRGVATDFAELVRISENKSKHTHIHPEQVHAAPPTPERGPVIGTHKGRSRFTP